MPAQLRAETSYTWRCSDCGARAGETWPYATRALQEIDRHNSEHHSDVMETRIVERLQELTPGSDAQPYFVSECSTHLGYHLPIHSEGCPFSEVQKIHSPREQAVRERFANCNHQGQPCQHCGAELTRWGWIFNPHHPLDQLPHPTQ